GTWIVDEEDDMEQAIVSAVTDDTSEAKVTVHGVPDEPGIAARLFGALADRSINLDMIVQNTAAGGLADISFTVAKVDLERTTAVCDEVSHSLGASKVTSDDGIGRVSLVGAGMKSHPGVTARMFKTLADAGINIEMISTSSIRISCVIRAELVEDAVRRLHDAFELGVAP
ncbi:MAG TPA: ACT domain-containing protein, partial [Acidimicrobiales bacterium]|nr:ACT domain-containing protein [Acidimicrobiales bacterium]